MCFGVACMWTVHLCCGVVMSMSPVALVHACGPGWTRSIGRDVPGDAMSLCHQMELDGVPGASNVAPEAGR